VIVFSQSTLLASGDHRHGSRRRGAAAGGEGLVVGNGRPCCHFCSRRSMGLRGIRATSAAPLSHPQ
jgi:hypothetical protein